MPRVAVGTSAGGRWFSNRRVRRVRKGGWTWVDTLSQTETVVLGLAEKSDLDFPISLQIREKLFD